MDQVTRSSEQSGSSSFWKNALLDYCSISFPQRLPSTAAAKRFRSISFEFNTSESQSMLEFSRQSNVNLFCFFYLGLIQTLSTLTGRHDLGITTVVHSLDPVDLQLKLSPLLIRYRLNSKLSFNEQLSQASLAVLKTYEYRNADLERLLSELNLNSPELFQVSLTMVDAESRNLICLPCKETAKLPFPYHPPHAEISVSIQYTEEGIRGELRYEKDCYEAAFIQTLVDLFQKNLRGNLNFFK